MQSGDSIVTTISKIAVALVLVASASRSVRADDAAKDRQAVLEKGIAFLKQSQSSDGSWSAKRAGPGITALVVAAMVRSGVSTDDPAVAKALSYLESRVQKDGGIY